MKGGALFHDTQNLEAALVMVWEMKDPLESDSSQMSVNIYSSFNKESLGGEILFSICSPEEFCSDSFTLLCFLPAHDNHMIL